MVDWYSLIHLPPGLAESTGISSLVLWAVPGRQEIIHLSPCSLRKWDKSHPQALHARRSRQTKWILILIFNPSFKDLFTRKGPHMHSQPGTFNQLPTRRSLCMSLFQFMRARRVPLSVSELSPRLDDQTPGSSKLSSDSRSLRLHLCMCVNYPTQKPTDVEALQFLKNTTRK